MDIEDVKRLARATRRVGDLAARRVAELWEALPVADADLMEDALYQLYPRLVEEQAGMAAAAALEWYEDVRARETIGAAFSPSMPATVVDRDIAVVVVGRAMKDLRAGAAARARARLQEGARKFVADAGRTTTQNAAEQDPRKPRYARVPVGAETCAWCLLWASRGFVYKSEETAHFKRSHFKCDCQVVPSWSGARIRGYDHAPYERMYEAVREDILDLGLDRFADDVKFLTSRMRTLFPDGLSDGNVPGGIDPATGHYRLSDGTVLKFGPHDVKEPPGFLRHVLRGDATSRGRPTGGHSYRAAVERPYPGLIVFPESWSDSDIDRALTLAWLQPRAVQSKATNPILRCVKTVEDVSVQVQVIVQKKGSSGKLNTGYPTRGNGVMRYNGTIFTPVE